MLTQAYLKSILNYDPDSGIWAWIKPRPKIRIGQVAGSLSDHGYIKIRIDGNHYHAHRLAILYVTGEWPKNDVDHISGIRNDNRWSNLRLATRSENRQNMKKASKNSTTGSLGVTPVGSKFIARIKNNGISKHLGTFDTQEEAHSAYLEAKRNLHPFSTI